MSGKKTPKSQSKGGRGRTGDDHSGAKLSRSKSVRKYSYPSRLVDASMNKSIIRVLQGLTAQQGSLKIQKWLAKMKFSVLKKVSAASKVLFQDAAHNEQALQEEIDQLHIRIASQAARVKTIAMRHVQSLDLLQLPSLAKSSYQSGQFESGAQKVSDQFNAVAKELSAVNSELQGRVESFQSSLASVRTHAPVILAALQQRRQQQLVAGSATTGSVDASLQTIARHLSDNP